MSIQKKIEHKLLEFFPTDILQVENESHKHAVPKGSESHFMVVVVSEKFQGLSLLKRHRLIQDLLREEVSQIRALSLHTLTQQENNTRQGSPFQGSTCKGG
jgi:stress-induced morphogen